MLGIYQKGRKDKAMFGKKRSFTETEKKLLFALLEKKRSDLNTAENYFLLAANRTNVTEFATAILEVLAKEVHDKANNENNQ
jgi:hypothetical protein